MTAIRSTVQFLLQEFTDGHPKRPLIEGVIAEVDRIDRTVEGLLSLTRRAEFKPDKIALGHLIKQTLLLLETQAQHQSVEIILLMPGPDLNIMGDVSQLKQVFMNITLNALQAMPHGGRLEIGLGIGPQPAEAGNKKLWAQASFADCGCGIPAEISDKVFDPFFTTKRGGTGLGLSISYAIIRQHGGELEVHSQEGKGTTVTVRLPLPGELRSALRATYEA
jgi:signal transduction histidine kinase